MAKRKKRPETAEGSLLLVVLMLMLMLLGRRRGRRRLLAGCGAGGAVGVTPFFDGIRGKFLHLEPEAEGSTFLYYLDLGSCCRLL